MRVNTECVLIFGLPASELEEGVTGDLRDTLSDVGLEATFGSNFDDGLEWAAPHLDADAVDCVWGVVLAASSGMGGEIDLAKLPEEVAEASIEVKKITGLEGRLFISADVSRDPTAGWVTSGFRAASPRPDDRASLRAYLAAHAPEVPNDFVRLSVNKVSVRIDGLKQIGPAIEPYANTLVRWRLHYADMMIEALK